MNYSKVMLRVFSNSEADRDFQKKFGEALDLTEDQGSAKLVSDEGDEEKVDLSFTKNDDGSVTVDDNINNEVTKVTDDGDQTLLEKVETDTTPESEPAPATVDEDSVTVKEIKKDEEYSVVSKQGTFSVKGTFLTAIKTAKRFSENVVMDLTDVTDNMEPEKHVPANIGVEDPEKSGTPEARAFALNPDKVKAIHDALAEAEKSGKPYTNEDIAKKLGCKPEDVTEARKSFSATEKKYTVEFYKSDGSDGKTITMTGTGKDDIIIKAEEKAKSFGPDWEVGSITQTMSDTNSDEKNTAEEALEAAKEHAKEDEDGAIVKTESATVHVKYDKEAKKFSYTKIDLKNRNFSDIPEDDIVAELEGTNMDPEKNMPADKGIIDPEKTGTPEARQFSQEQVDAALAKDAKDETEEDKAALKEAADAGCEKSKAKLAEIQACGTQKFSDLEEGVNQLEKKAEEVSSQPTEENAQSLKKDAEELEEKINSDKTYSSIKKEVLLNRVKFYSMIAENAYKNARTAPAELTEEQNRAFSELLKFDVKQFASKEDIEAATKAFSQTEGAAENPCLTAQF